MPIASQGDAAWFGWVFPLGLLLFDQNCQVIQSSLYFEAIETKREDNFPGATFL